MTSVRPEDFVVDDKQPFDHDLLDRKDRVEGLCSLVESLSTPAVLAVNGPFGSGKSVFLRMCASRLRSRKVKVAEFDAWQQSHTQTPLVDLVSAVTSSDRFSEETARSLGNAAARLAWHVASAVTHGIVQREDFELGDKSRFDEWAQIEQRREEFRKELGQLVDRDGKLVVLIDELDRCPPERALEILDVARHLFDVAGVVVVLGINESELQQRVKTVYGEGCDAEKYLRRFIDLMIDLPRPGATLVGFMNETFTSVGLSGNLKAGSNYYSGSMLEILADRTEMSLRDIMQFTHRIARVFALLPATEPSEGPGGPMELLTVALCVLRWADPTGYRELTAGNVDMAEAVYLLVQALSLEERLAEEDLMVLVPLASLLWLDSASATKERLEAAGFGSVAADTILDLFQTRFANSAFWGGPSRDQIFGFVELLA